MYELKNRKDISDTLRKLKGIKLSTVGEDHEQYSQMMSGLEMENGVKKEEVPELSDGESERRSGSSVRDGTEEVEVEGVLEEGEIPLTEILPVQALIVAGIL